MDSIKVRQVVDEFARPCVMARKGMGLVAWLKSDDTGLSSKYMAYMIWGNPTRVENNHPLDPDDFGRCCRFLDAVPGSREKIALLAVPECGPVWKRLIEAWDELERIYLEELPSGKCPRLYERMKQIIADAGGYGIPSAPNGPAFRCINLFDPEPTPIDCEANREKS